MKLTLTNIKTIKQNTENKLTRNVCNYVIDKWSEYDNKKGIFTDVLNYGCKSGIINLNFY